MVTVDRSANGVSLHGTGSRMMHPPRELEIDEPWSATVPDMEGCIR